MSTTQLTPTQQAILTHAIEHTEGRIDWFPDTVNGGARVKVLAALANRRLAIHRDGAWRVTEAGYDALGARCPNVDTGYTGYGASRVLLDEIDEADPTDAEIAQSNVVDPDLEVDVAAAEASIASAQARAPAPTSRRTRDNTKQATLIAMLRRPEGATIAQMASALEWQAHTVRGALAGALKKKLGLTLASEKVPGADRVYRIPGEAA
jgi:hypothetical protein